MNARRPVLWLLPGAHKTGTTAVQHLLAAHRTQLENAGIHYLDREVFYGSALRQFLSQGVYYQGNQIDLASAIISMKDILRVGDRFSTYVVFIENIFGEPVYGMWSKVKSTPALYPGFATGLDNFIRVADNLFDVRALYLIRRQDMFLESLYAEFLHNGWVFSVEDYLRALIGCDLSWARIYRLLRAALHPPHVHLVPYEPLTRGIAGFLAMLFEKMSLPLTIDNWRLDMFDNASLSARGIKIALSAFPELEENERREFLAFLRPRFNVKTDRRFRIFSDYERAGLVERYAPENEALLREEGYSDPRLLGYYRGEVTSLSEGS